MNGLISDEYAFISFKKPLSRRLLIKDGLKGKLLPAHAS